MFFRGLNNFNAVGRISMDPRANALNRTTRRTNRPLGAANFRLAIPRYHNDKTHKDVCSYVPFTYYGTLKQVQAFAKYITTGTEIWIKNAQYISTTHKANNTTYNDSYFAINNSHDYDVISWGKHNSRTANNSQARTNSYAYHGNQSQTNYANHGQAPANPFAKQSRQPQTNYANNGQTVANNGGNGQQVNGQTVANNGGNSQRINANDLPF